MFTVARWSSHNIVTPDDLGTGEKVLKKHTTEFTRGYGEKN